MMQNSLEVAQTLIPPVEIWTPIWIFFYFFFYGPFGCRELGEKKEVKDKFKYHILI